MSRKPFHALITALLIAGAVPAAAQTPGPTVTIDSGTLEGRAAGGMLAFKGIPYAAAPTGALRWRAPQPVKPWPGVRPATAFGHDCMQKPEPGDAAPPGTTPSEDCLVLNVWRPATATAGERLPVLVWIYGGAYVNGGASTPIYDGSALARHGLVVVSFNYRLGRFGFFAHPALLAAQEGPVGNFGLMDQIEALRWVKRNIAAFGGDPGQVTAVGESAGGISVMALLTSPEGKGLFHRAVVMSGGGRTLLGGAALTGGTPQVPSADQVGTNFARSVGIQGSGPGALRALRALPAATIRGELNMSSLLQRSPGPPTWGRGPIVDGRIVTALPGESLRRGEAARLPLLIGTTSADLPAIFPPSPAAPLAFFGPDAGKARALYDPGGTLSPLQLYLAIGVDLTMHEPARFVARQMTQAGAPAWLYRFDYVAQSLRPKVTGAGHASELPFLFDTLEARYGTATSDGDRATAKALNRYVANFARSGDPNGPGLPAWPKFDPATANALHFTPDKGPLAEADPWKERLDLVERAVDAQAATEAAARDLVGTWQLVKFAGSDDRTLTPDDRAKYTLAFAAAGRVGLRIDCNRGSAPWTSAGLRQLQFGPAVLTRAQCPPGALHDRLVKDLPAVRSYTMKDGHLFLALMADGGIYEFEPVAGPRRQR